MKNFKSGGDLFTMKEFKEDVDDFSLTDYDGYGKYSDGEDVFDEVVDLYNIDMKRSHVVWYNK